MRIEIEVDEDGFRQPDVERKDNGDDLTRSFTWLRLPDDVRRGLIRLLGRTSLNDLLALGIPKEEALKVLDIHTALM